MRGGIFEKEVNFSSVRELRSPASTSIRKEHLKDLNALLRLN